jgi:hypothetical protein
MSLYISIKLKAKRRGEARTRIHAIKVDKLKDKASYDDLVLTLKKYFDEYYEEIEWAGLMIKKQTTVVIDGSTIVSWKTIHDYHRILDREENV